MLEGEVDSREPSEDAGVPWYLWSAFPITITPSDIRAKRAPALFARGRCYALSTCASRSVDARRHVTLLGTQKCRGHGVDPFTLLHHVFCNVSPPVDTWRGADSRPKICSVTSTI